MGYWRYTLNELGVFDVSAQIDKIHEVKMQELGGRDPRHDLRYAASDLPGTPLKRRVGPFAKPTGPAAAAMLGSLGAVALAPDGELLFRGAGVVAAPTSRAQAGAAGLRQLGVQRSLSDAFGPLSRAPSAPLAASFSGGGAGAGAAAAAPAGPAGRVGGSAGGAAHASDEQKPGLVRGWLRLTGDARRPRSSSYDGCGGGGSMPGASAAAAAAATTARTPSSQLPTISNGGESDPEPSSAAAARPKRVRRASQLADRVIQGAVKLGNSISSSLSGLTRPHQQTDQLQQQTDHQHHHHHQQQQQQFGLPPGGSSADEAQFDTAPTSPHEAAAPELLQGRPPSALFTEAFEGHPQVKGSDHPRHHQPHDGDGLQHHGSDEVVADVFHSPFAAATSAMAQRSPPATLTPPATSVTTPNTWPRRSVSSGGGAPASAGGGGGAALYGPDGGSGTTAAQAAATGAVAAAGTVMAGVVIGTVAVAEATRLAATTLANVLKGGSASVGEGPEGGRGGGGVSEEEEEGLPDQAPDSLGDVEPLELGLGEAEAADAAAADAAAEQQSGETTAAAAAAAAGVVDSPAVAPLRRAQSSQAMFTLARAGGSTGELLGSSYGLRSLADGAGGSSGGGAAAAPPSPLRAGGSGAVGGLHHTSTSGGGTATSTPTSAGLAGGRSQSVSIGALAAASGSLAGPHANSMALDASAGGAAEPYNLRVVAHSLGGASMLIYLVMRLRSGRPHHCKRLVLLTPAGFHAVVGGWAACVGGSRVVMMELMMCLDSFISQPDAPSITHPPILPPFLSTFHPSTTTATGAVGVLPRHVHHTPRGQAHAHAAGPRRGRGPLRACPPWGTSCASSCASRSTGTAPSGTAPCRCRTTTPSPCPRSRCTRGCTSRSCTAAAGLCSTTTAQRRPTRCTTATPPPPMWRPSTGGWTSPWTSAPGRTTA